MLISWSSVCFSPAQLSKETVLNFYQKMTMLNTMDRILYESQRQVCLYSCISRFKRRTAEKCFLICLCYRVGSLFTWQTMVKRGHILVVLLLLTQMTWSLVNTEKLVRIKLPRNFCSSYRENECFCFPSARLKLFGVKSDDFITIQKFLFYHC